MPLDLPEGFTMEIEDTSPIFNDVGSQSVSATVALTSRNIRALGAPYRIDAGLDPNLPLQRAEVTDGSYRRSGKLNVTEAGRSEGITFNIGFDNSEAYAEWQTKTMRDLKDLPVDRRNTTAAHWMLDFPRFFEEPAEYDLDFSIFPLAVKKDTLTVDDKETTYWEVLNVPKGFQDFTQPRTVKRVIDGELKDVNVPEGYGLTVFLKVWRVLELVFSDLGLKISSNPFRDDTELSRLVMLNNSVDTICGGEIRYKDLMPDCTVSEFLNALYVRFGMVYRTDFDAGVVEIRLIKDILSDPVNLDLSGMMSTPEKITYESKQYVKLKAATNIEGAAPLTERFEDFAMGADLSNIGLGQNVANWKNVGTATSPEWDGDIGDGRYEDDYDPNRDPDEWEPPSGWDDDYDDWWDDRDDDYDMYDTRAAKVSSDSRGFYLSSNQRSADSSAPTLARECVTGKWYRLDGVNGRVKETSSSFFSWDPQSEGLTAVDLSSVDECVPIMNVTTEGKTGWQYMERCPAYLFGSRHFHTYVKESGNAEDSGEETPLAFMFAYTWGRRTYGRLNGENYNGQAVTLDDGTRPRLSLLFQFRDGLFYNFWRQYDEILRHGNRVVEIETGIPKFRIPELLKLKPVALRGVKCLVDSATYQLPAPSTIDVNIKLRTMMTQGNYDIEAEQNVPRFAICNGGDVL